MNSIKYFLAIALIFFLTMLIVMTGCHNNCTHEVVDWEDSDEWHKIWYEKIDTNSNGEADETEHYEYHGKEGKSEYGEYKPNKCLEWGEDPYNKWMEIQ
tara:strand:- start:193 stop:489 length:297 start_codon:yes stop_codon:yes gene_type:complete